VLVFLVERRSFVDLVELAVDADAGVAGLLPLGEFLAVLALAAADDRGEQIKARAFGESHHPVDHLADLLGGDRLAGRGAVGHADARPEQAHIVVDLGDGGDGGARVAAGRLLLDRNGGAEALDVIDVRLLHQLEELARIGGQALDIAPLPLGIDGVEGEAGLARARQAGDHDQLVARQIDVDALQVMLARAAHLNVSQHVRSSTSVPERMLAEDRSWAGAAPVYPSAKGQIQLRPMVLLDIVLCLFV
jgi:hypothetical protein